MLKYPVYCFVNNCTDHVECGFECAGLKMLAYEIEFTV